MSKQPIVRAIDVGYGNTKYVSYVSAAAGVQCSVFPSITPQEGAGPDLAVGMLRKRNTVVVEVDGVRYEVGRDARLAQDASYGRTLDPSYSASPSYMALIRGALHYMGQTEIDLLVLGLPVNTFASHGKQLEARVKGTHRVPTIDGHSTVDVVVRRVSVVPQPIGGFFDYAIGNQLYERMKNQMNLLIDPGFYTLDWVVAQGAKMVSARSGAHAGGMSAILAAIADPVAKKLGTQSPDIGVIDEALASGSAPRFFGKPFPLDEYIPYGKEKARQFVAVLANKVGNAMDIDNVVLVGGGATFFKDVLQRQFPHHEIVIAPDPIFANVRGFQIAGEQAARQLGLQPSTAGVA